MAVSHVKSNIIPDFTGVVTVPTQTGGTSTVNATDLVRPSDWNSAHNQYLTLSGNTAGGSTLSGSNIVLQGGANVTLSANGNTLVFSADAGAGGGMGISAGTQSVSTGTMIFADSNGIAFGMSGSSQITASYSQSTHSHATAAYSGSNGSFTANTLSFGSSNGAHFYTTNGSIVASYTVPAAQTNVAFSADASSTFQTLTFQNSNGVSFSNNAGALRVTHDLQFTSATSAITSNALHSSASRVINIVAATNNTGGGTASLSSNVSFSAANGITFYTSAGGAVVASHNALTTARASTDAIGLNTAQTNVTWTVNSSGLSLNASGYAGTGTSITGNASITLDSVGLKFNGSGLAGTSTGFAGANISGSITMNSSGLNLSLSVAAPGAAAEQNAVNLLGANTAGNTTATGSTLGFSGVNITLSGTNNSQIVFSGNPAQTNVAFSAGAASSTFQTLTFQDSNNVSFSNNAGAIRVTHNLAGTGTAVTGLASMTLNSTGLSFNGSGLAGTNTATTGGHFAWTVNSSGISINGSNIAGTTTAITGRASITMNTAGFQFNGSNLAGVGTGTAVTGRASITLTANSSSIAMSFDGNGIAGTGFTTGTTTGAWTATLSTNGLSEVIPYLTRYIHPPGVLETVSTHGNASHSFQYMAFPGNMTATRVDGLMQLSFSSSVGAGTVTYVQSRYIVIYTKNGNTLSSVSSGSTQTTYTFASNTAGATYLTGASVIYPISVPININMQPGEYYIGFNLVTAGTAVTHTNRMVGEVVANFKFADFAATATSTNMTGGVGIYSVATTGGRPTAALSDIMQTGTNADNAALGFIFRNA